jgi:symplekin
VEEHFAGCALLKSLAWCT